MRGLSAEVLDWSGSEGHVFTNGERWQAHGAEVLAPGETVEVASIKDLTLVVRRRSARTVSEGGRDDVQLSGLSSSRSRRGHSRRQRGISLRSCRCLVRLRLWNKNSEGVDG